MANARAMRPKPRPKMPRKAGDLTGLRRRLWWAVIHCEGLLAMAETDEMILRTVHALTQCSLAYVKLVEVSELQERLGVTTASGELTNEPRIAGVCQRCGEALYCLPCQVPEAEARYSRRPWNGWHGSACPVGCGADRTPEAMMIPHRLAIVVALRQPRQHAADHA